MQSASLLALLTTSLVLDAQETTIRTNVPLVAVSTGVIDRRGHAINGLTASDFLVLDNGKARAVHVDVSDSESTPIALVVAIQASGFSDPAIKKLQKTASVISQSVLGANGEAAVLAFGDEVTVVQEFTQNQEQISDAVASFKPVSTAGGARMIDAIQESIDLLAHRDGPRRSCILLISEARDRGSKLKMADVLSAVERSGAVIYGLTYSPYLTAFTTKSKDYTPPPMAEDPGVRDSVSIPAIILEVAHQAGKNTIEGFTAATGGRRMSFETVSKLEADLMAVGSDIHSRYLISFTPEDSRTDSFHTLEIKVRKKPDAIVRARPGYWSGAMPASGQ